MALNLFGGKKEKTLGEIEDENEKEQAEDELLGTKLSVARKKVMIAELKKRGLEPKHFGFDFSKIMQWLKTH